MGASEQSKPVSGTDSRATNADRQASTKENPYSPTPRVSDPNATIRKIPVRWKATVIPFVAYCLWQWLQMTPNTSFEHHPYSGALILIHESQSTGQLVVCSVICLVMVGGIFAAVIRPSVLTVLVSASSLMAWFYLSYTLAVWASC